MPPDGSVRFPAYITAERLSINISVWEGNAPCVRVGIKGEKAAGKYWLTATYLNL